MTEHFETKVKYIESETLIGMEIELNSFFKGKWIISSPIFMPEFENDSYKCLIYYKVPQETQGLKEERRIIPATQKQMNLLKKLKYTGSLDLSINEAKEEIEKRLKK